MQILLCRELLRVYFVFYVEYIIIRRRAKIL